MRSMRRIFLDFRMGSGRGAVHMRPWMRLCGDHDEACKLGAGRRHSGLFRCHRSRVAGKVRRAPDRGQAGDPPYQEVAQCRGVGGWERSRKRGFPKGEVSALCWRTSIFTMCSISGPTAGDGNKRAVKCYRAFCRRFRGRVSVPGGCRAVWGRASGAPVLGTATERRGKTRLIEFGRFAAGNRAKRGEGKPESFDFLGFSHVRTDPEGEVYCASADREEDAGQIEGSEGGTSAQAAASRFGGRAMVADRVAGALPLFWSAQQYAKWQPFDTMLAGCGIGPSVTEPTAG